jgi:ABC-type proline/glycine betaine transport system substrate-binding protein
MQAHGNDPDKAAVWFLQTNPDLWQAWIEDPQVVQAVTEALAKEK